MKPRLLLSALLAFAPAFPAAAQVRVAVPGAVSVVPSFSPALAPGVLAPSLSGPAFAPSLSPSLSAPSAFHAEGFPVIPALAASVIPAAAITPAALASVVPAALASGVLPAAAKPTGDGSRKQTVTSLKDLNRLAGFENAGAGAAFDGVAPKPALDATSAPLGAKSVTVIRLNHASEASRYIPHTPNTEALIQGLARNWDRIGWLDLRVYTDVDGGTFRAIDLSGRPDLARLIPEVQSHEAELIRKIQLHSDDLALVIREEGKTPDLIVDGVVTEMKSLFPKGEFAVQLAHANAQVLQHARRHKLAPGAAAIDLTLRDVVPVVEIRDELNAYVKSGEEIGVATVDVYAGKDRQTFVRTADGTFALLGTKGAPLAPLSPAGTKARFLVPNVLGLTADPDAARIHREVTEPFHHLREAGVKATVTVYGSARILPADIARARLNALLKKYGGKPKDVEARKLIYAARQAVEVSKFYGVAREFGRIVAHEGGGEVAIVTGGGPGIMEAANRGALEAGGPSVGYNIVLDKEQGLNQYVTPGLEFEFHHFATRKMALRHGAMGLVYFPGGFGTMDELFEVLTLMQTRKMLRVPIVLIGEKAYWDKILDFDEFAREGLISSGDLSLFRFADTAQTAWREILAQPVVH